MPDDRLAHQIAFLIDADKLKQIIRRTPLVDSSRLENSAEHSWHLILTAIVMREYMTVEFDLLHAVEMLAVHDLVEIDAGDTFAYDAAGQMTKSAARTHRRRANIRAASARSGFSPPCPLGRVRSSGNSSVAFRERHGSPTAPSAECAFRRRKLAH